MSSDEPQLSVIVVVGTQRERAGRAVQSILSQEGLEEAEVILVDTCPALAPIPGSDHAAVRIVPITGPSTFGNARAAGVHAAHGRNIAFLEEHSLAFPGWLKSILAAFAGRWVGVGAEIHNANAGVGISDAVWLMNYVPAFRPPARYGPSRNIPGHNSAYRREVLLGLGDDLPPLLQSEVVLQWKLGQQGHEIGLDPAIKLAHSGETSLPAIVHGYYVMHRHFGAHRARAAGWSLGRRLLRVLSTPLVPFVRFTRYVFAALRERSSDLRIILRFPLTILIAQSAAAVGMTMGYVFGPGDSETQFLAVETNAPRGS
jgi:hypothetical protein